MVSMVPDQRSWKGGRQLHACLPPFLTPRLVLTPTGRVLEQRGVYRARRHADISHDGSTDEDVLDRELGSV